MGGQSIPGGNPGSLLVWAITAHGRVSNHFIIVWIVTDFYKLISRGDGSLIFTEY